MNHFAPFTHPYLVPFDGSFRLADAPTDPPHDAPTKTDDEQVLSELIERLDRAQRLLYAHDRFALLLVFQAMDAAGKDSTIRAVMRGVDPAGCQVYSFKEPSAEELDHDFMWRIYRALPERGRIGIFNRSHYEEVITVKVNPDFLAAQRLAQMPEERSTLWEHRYESIRDVEHHWARSDIVVLKFFLHVSKKEQKKRFLRRLDEPDHRWKFSAGDLKVRKQWDDYMRAYEDALRATSRPWAPWYAIPADSKPFMRRTVAEIIVATLERLPLAYPALAKAEASELARLREQLARE